MSDTEKVLVTGGAGFIGVHLVERLAARGNDVLVVDNLKRSSRARLSSAIGSGRVELFEHDIRHYDGLAAAMRGCRTVFHLAAQSNVMGAAEDPDYSVTTNVIGTLNTLRAAASAGVSRLVFTSSREVYGDPERLPVDEDRPLIPKNAYGASKVSGEAYCHTFARTGGLSVEIVRLSNVYGPGDSGRVIPLWMDAALAGRDLEVYGGEQLIDFVWVGTVVDALLFAARHGLPEPVNVASGTGTKILDLADRILEHARSSSRVRRTPARAIEVARFVADTSRMRALGLTPDADPLAHLGELFAAQPRPG